MTQALLRWRALALLLVVMWLLEAVNFLVGHRLNAFGIEPRTLGGLAGIVWAPLLHAGFGHLASNSVALAALGGLIAFGGERRFVTVTLYIGLLGGAVTWLLGRPGQHVGASLLVFGYFGYLLGRGWVERTLLDVAVAALVIAVWGGLLFGLLPRTNISFEGHLFGLLAGASAALWTGRNRPGGGRE